MDVNHDLCLVFLTGILSCHGLYQDNIIFRFLIYFCNFLVQIYQNFRTTVSYFFDESSTADVQLAAAHHNLGYMGQMRSPAGGLMSGQLNPSTRSFKVVTECPLIVMFLFQLYPRYVPQNIPVLLPLMVSAIGITGPTEVPQTLKNVYAELKGAQVKVLFAVADAFLPSF